MVVERRKRRKGQEEKEEKKKKKKRTINIQSLIISVGKDIECHLITFIDSSVFNLICVLWFDLNDGLFSNIFVCFVFFLFF